ncbi:hypothetical protein VL20_4221 [Microcystis panniformis FACHB-1757]|uniref:Uncharacterized protein n=1 Tax=Microcystis panniformis FACHB-1757 TaxID=1638788 RepID=A0A0K1S540_9CHRO|nr:hypothetical protein VL20_4221 [Microcystis panniformis FACHB-1757]
MTSKPQREEPVVRRTKHKEILGNFIPIFPFLNSQKSIMPEA